MSTIKKLIVTVKEAKGLKETNLLTKMTTYVHFKCGGEEFKTKPAVKGDKNPKYNDQAFVFNLDGKEDVVHIVVYSKETISDDRIGRVDIKITDMAKAEKPTWFDIFDVDNFSKVHGQLLLQVEAEPKPHHHHKEAEQKAQTVQVQQPQMVQQQQPQVVMQQPQMMFQQPQQFGMQQFGMPAAEIIMVNPQTGQPQVIMMGQQPAFTFGAQQPMYGAPVFIPPRQ